MAETRRPIAPVVIEALMAVKDHATSVAGLIRYDLRDAQQRYLLAYFCTVIELTAACTVLAQTTENVGIPILARSALEAFVDFRCLRADPRYGECIEAAHDREWAKVIDEAMSAGGAYLGQLGAEAAVQEERARIAHRQEHRGALGIRKLTAKERFARAGLHELYYSVYNFLCAEAHNDARALISRHIKEDDAGVVRLTIYGDDLAFVETGLMQVHDALSAMTEAICETFRVTEPDRSRVDTTFAAAKRWVGSQERPEATAERAPGEPT
jgi:Family of unknown function (DUF5677)